MFGYSNTGTTRPGIFVCNDQFSSPYGMNSSSHYYLADRVTEERYEITGDRWTSNNWAGIFIVRPPMWSDWSNPAALYSFDICSQRRLS